MYTVATTVHIINIFVLLARSCCPFGPQTLCIDEVSQEVSSPLAQRHRLSCLRPSIENRQRPVGAAANSHNNNIASGHWTNYCRAVEDRGLAASLRLIISYARPRPSLQIGARENAGTVARVVATAYHLSPLPRAVARPFAVRPHKSGPRVQHVKNISRRIIHLYCTTCRARHPHVNQSQPWH